MNKKMIALIVLMVMVIGVYGAYYTYATTVLMPEDLKTFESELNATSEPVISESDITSMETNATLIENAPSLKNIMPSSDRQSSANGLRQQMAPVKSEMQEIRQNLTTNRDIAARYDLILKGDTAKNIRATYNDDYINTADQMMKIDDNIATDLENGDNKALANDMRELSKIARKFNNETAEAHTNLQKIVKEMGG